MSLTRKEFLRSVVAGVAGVAGAAALMACADDGGDDGGGSGGNCTTNGTAVTIGSNHPTGPHSLVVSKDDVVAAAEKTYSIKGQSAHDHMYTVTVTQFAMLKNSNGSINVTMLPDSTGHTHSLTISCA